MAAPVVPARWILLVDDEPLVRDSVQRMLATCGHEVAAAAGGEEALALFEKQKFDLAIIDYAMPVMKGDELAAILKSRDASVPVLMISASAEKLQALGRSLAGVDVIIGKPFQMEELLDAVARILPDKCSGG